MKRLRWLWYDNFDLDWLVIWTVLGLGIAGMGYVFVDVGLYLWGL